MGHEIQSLKTNHTDKRSVLYLREAFSARNPPSGDINVYFCTIEHFSIN